MFQKTARLVLEADSRQIKTAGRDLQDFERRAKSVEAGAAKLGRAVGLAFAAFATGAFVRQVINNTIEQERAIAQLDATLRATGNTTGFTSQELQKMASELQKVTTFGDETVIAAQGLLASFKNISGNTFPRATEAALDLATAMQMDLQSAVRMVGRSLDDPIQGLNALTRTGVTFTDSQKNLIKELVNTGRAAEAQNIILKELEGRFKGSARAARDTLGGAFKSLKNAAGDLLEGKGGSVKGITQAINDLTDVLNSPEVKAGFQSMVNGILAVIRVAAQGITAVANFSRFIAQEIGAYWSGPGKDDLVRLDEAVIKQREIVRQLQQNLSNARGVGQQNKIQIGLAAAQEELTRRIKASEDAWDRARQAATRAGSAGAASTKPVIAGLNGVIAATTGTRTATNQLFDSIQRQVEGLQLQAATLGMSETQVTLYRLAIEGATPAQLDLAAAALSTVDAFREQAKAAEAAAQSEKARTDIRNRFFEETRTVSEKLAIDIAELDALVDDGTIGWDLYARKLAQTGEQFLALGDKAGETKTDLDTFAKTAAENMQNAFAEFLFNPFDKRLKGMLIGFVDMLRKRVSAQLAQKLFGAGGNGGSFGAALSAVGSFMGMKDGGGSVPAGSWAIAGERGPEIVRGPATVTSRADTASQMGSSPNIRIINAIDDSTLSNWLGSGNDEIIMNIVGRNQGAFRALMGA